MALSAPIVPVSPVADQRISATNASIIIDFENNPDIVRINGVLAYDSGSGFLGGYSGSIITWTDGKRIYLDPPSAFTRDALIPVHAEDDSINELDYNFIAAIDQMTTTDDASNPDIIDLDGTNVFVAYDKRDPTSPTIGSITINMRKHDPNTSEIEVITGTLVGYGHNPVTSKLIAFFNINGVIYATEADAADVPVTLTDVTDLQDFAPSSSGVGRYKDTTVDKTQFTVTKKFITDTLKSLSGVGRRAYYRKTPFEEHGPQAELIAADPVTIRITPPVSEPETSAIYGYYVGLYYPSLNIFSGEFEFVSYTGALWEDWTDTGRATDTQYVIIPLYLFNDDQVEPTIGPPIDPIEVPPTFAGDVLKSTSGVGRRSSIVRVQFTAEKLFPTDTLKTLPGVGRRFNANITGFAPKGIG